MVKVWGANSTGGSLLGLLFFLWPQYPWPGRQGAEPKTTIKVGEPVRDVEGRRLGGRPRGPRSGRL